MTNDDAELLSESTRLHYLLRSSYFYRKLKEYNTLAFPVIIADLLAFEHFYSWDNRADWGIEEDAFSYIERHQDLRFLEIFCHPKLLRQHPNTITYYQNIAALSQKAVTSLTSFDFKKYEDYKANRRLLTDTQAISLSRLFNKHISLIINCSLQSLSKGEIYGLLLTSTGAEIVDTWRGKIGEEAEKCVQRLLIYEAKKRELLLALISTTGISVVVYDPAKSAEQLGHIEHYRGIHLTNQTSILFHNEPDLILLNRQGATVGVIEVKGGADPAGALERYGAAKKSFEESRRINAQVKTMLVASCITSEVQARIQQDPTVSSYFNLTEMLSDAAIADQFMQQVFSLLEA